MRVYDGQRWIRYRGIVGECPVCGERAYVAERKCMTDGFGFWAHDEGCPAGMCREWHGLGSLASMIVPEDFCAIMAAAGEDALFWPEKWRRPVRCVETGTVYPSIASAAKKAGVSNSCISRAAKEGGMAAGHRWAFDDSERREIEAHIASFAEGPIARRRMMSDSEKRAYRDLIASVSAMDPAEAEASAAAAGVVTNRAGLVAKNRLPCDVGVEFKTALQWDVLGFDVEPGARRVPMAANTNGLRPYGFVHLSDVVPRDASDSFMRRFELRQEKLAEILRVSTGHGGISANFPACETF